MLHNSDPSLKAGALVKCQTKDPSLKAGASDPKPNTIYGIISECQGAPGFYLGGDSADY